MLGIQTPLLTVGIKTAEIQTTLYLYKGQM